VGDLVKGDFQTVINETASLEPDTVRRVVFCSGKVYFDLVDTRNEQHLTDVAIVRIEQLYPFPVAEYEAAVTAWPNATDIVWCQEEPKNQGAWYQIRHHLVAALDDERHRISYAGGAASAAPATGVFALHVKRQRALIADALGLATGQTGGKPASNKRNRKS